MDISTIASLVSSVGFPIIMCIILVVQMQKDEDENKELMMRWVETITNNTNALSRLADKLDKKGDT